MTQSPIEPRHKDEAAKAAGYATPADLAAVRGFNATAHDSILAHAQTLANDEAKGKALAEIDRIARHIVDDSRGEKIATIAAPYRASDPVAEALKAIIEEGWPNLVGMHRPAFDLALAKFRAFIEGGAHDEH